MEAKPFVERVIGAVLTATVIVIDILGLALLPTDAELLGITVWKIAVTATVIAVIILAHGYQRENKHLRNKLQEHKEGPAYRYSCFQHALREHLDSAAAMLIAMQNPKTRPSNETLWEWREDAGRLLNDALGSAYKQRLCVKYNTLKQLTDLGPSRVGFLQDHQNILMDIRKDVDAAYILPTFKPDEW